MESFPVAELRNFLDDGYHWKQASPATTIYNSDLTQYSMLNVLTHSRARVLADGNFCNSCRLVYWRTASGETLFCQTKRLVADQADHTLSRKLFLA